MGSGQHGPRRDSARCAANDPTRSWRAAGANCALRACIHARGLAAGGETVVAHIALANDAALRDSAPHLWRGEPDSLSKVGNRQLLKLNRKDPGEIRVR